MRASDSENGSCSVEARRGRGIADRHPRALAQIVRGGDHRAMNEEQRKLRLEEILPLKRALMGAVERAERAMPPLHERGRWGMEPVTDVKRKLGLLTFTDGKALGRDFLALCDEAGKLWFKTSAALRTKDIYEEDAPLEKIRNEYLKAGGQALVEKIKAEYDRLSKELENALA